MKGRLSQIAQDPKRPGCQQDALIVARIPAAPQTLVSGVEPEWWESFR